MTELECRALNVGDAVLSEAGVRGVVSRSSPLPPFYRSGRRRFARSVWIRWANGHSVAVCSDDLPLGWEVVRVVPRV